jgi:hypothetical protein
LPSFDLGSRRIAYAIIKGTSRKYTYFRFRQDMTLEVILPRGQTVDVEEAIREKSAWLRREYERFHNTRSVLTREGVMFDGEFLKFVYCEGPEDLFVPRPTRGEVIVHTRDGKRLRELIRRWFLSESSAYAVKKVALLAPRVGVRPGRVDTREIGKWGYCTREGRLSFSWQLIALPERLREYIILHELTHLLEFNHSTAFKKRLEGVCPDFKAREEELDLISPYKRLAMY